MVMKVQYAKLGAIIILILISGFTLFYLLVLSDRDQPAEQLRRWMGREIVMSNRVQVFDADTSLSEKPYKILIYVDEQGCTSCKLRLSEWNDFQRLLDKIVPGEVAYRLVFDGRQIEDVRFLLKTHAWNKPLFWDKDGEMNRKYKFPKKEMFRCMLLDELDRVVLVGNPVHSEAIAKLYIQYFTEKLRK